MLSQEQAKERRTNERGRYVVSRKVFPAILSTTVTGSLVLLRVTYDSARNNVGW